MKAFLTTLWLGLRLCLVLQLPAGRQIRPSAQFWPLLALQALSSIAIAWFYAVDGADFDPMGLQGDGFLALLTLASAVAAATLLRRPVVAWSLAVLWLAAGLWLSWIWVLLEWMLSLSGLALADYQLAIRLALLLWWSAIVWRTLGPVAPGRPLFRSWVALTAALVSAAPALFLPLSGYFVLSDPGSISAQAAPEEINWAPRWPLRRTPEQLLAAQLPMVDEALAGLRPQDPNKVDAYLLAFGGDGSEGVFRNEIEYSQALFAQRFGMNGQTLGLLNSPGTAGGVPLASLSNLRAALKGLGQVMDRDQDLLFLFLTSHGSADHQLYVDLLGLPLDQIDPEQLKEAINDSGIVWKVVVVSACYSGGFVEALSDSTTLVITAARADRPSFGCGVDSDFTYFGRALLVDALNQTADWLVAFDLARERVAQREAEEELDPSEPQIASTALIEAKLQAWQAQLQPGPAVPLAVASSDREDPDRASD